MKPDNHFPHGRHCRTAPEESALSQKISATTAADSPYDSFSSVLLTRLRRGPLLLRRANNERWRTTQRTHVGLDLNDNQEVAEHA